MWNKSKIYELIKILSLFSKPDISSESFHDNLPQKVERVAKITPSQWLWGAESQLAWDAMERALGRFPDNTLSISHYKKYLWQVATVIIFLTMSMWFLREQKRGNKELFMNLELQSSGWRKSRRIKKPALKRGI